MKKGVTWRQSEEFTRNACSAATALRTGREDAISYRGGEEPLFDVGYSDAFLTNARKLGVDLCDLDYVVLSHGHLDHTWGMFSLIQHYTEGLLEGREVKRPRLVAHPAVLASRKYGSMPEVGSLLTQEKLSGFFDLQLSREPRQLTEHLLFLGEIKRITDFEARESLGRMIENGQESDDDLRDDTAIVYQSAEGLVIITGCSHSGICNIVEQARTVCGDQRVMDIIGGFHLLKPSREQLAGTIEYLKAVNPKAVHACHCTDLMSKIELSKSVALKEVGGGLVIEGPPGFSEKPGGPSICQMRSPCQGGLRPPSPVDVTVASVWTGSAA